MDWANVVRQEIISDHLRISEVVSAPRSDRAKQMRPSYASLNGRTNLPSGDRSRLKYLIETVI